MHLKSGISLTFILNIAHAFKEDHLGFGPQINRHQQPEDSQDQLFLKLADNPQYKRYKTFNQKNMENSRPKHQKDYFFQQLQHGQCWYGAGLLVDQHFS